MRKKLFVAITALGISAAVFQLVVIREFMNLFAGLELVIGIILGNWLLLNGIGCFLGKLSERVKNKVRLLVILQGAIAVIPLIQIMLIRILRNGVFIRGESIGLLGIFIYSLLNLLPYCLICGFLLTMACVIYPPGKTSGDSAKGHGSDIEGDSVKGRSVGKVYAIDLLGDIIGGLVFSLVLVFVMNPVQIAVAIMLLNAACMFFILSEKKKLILPYAVIAAFALFSLVVLNADLNAYSIGRLYPGSEIQYSKDTPYGSLVVTRDLDQLNFFMDTTLLFSTDDTLTNEEDVHYALSQSEGPLENVLVISGGVSGMLKEINKYDAGEIDYVEMNPYITTIGKSFTTNLDSENVNVINNDPYIYLPETERRYDAIIMNMPDPKNALLSRFYSVEFFRLAKSRLNESGVFGLSLEGYSNFIPQEKSMLYSSVFNSLKSHFLNVIAIPGGKVYMIASDKELSYMVGELIEEKRIYTQYVNNNYLPGVLTQDRVKQIEGALDPDVPENTQFRPISYYFSLLDWLRIYGNGIYLIIMIAVPVMLFYILKLREISYPVFCVGFSSMALELVLIIGFQIIYGYVFQMIGLIMAMFMTGSAVGALAANRYVKKATKRHVRIIVGAMIVYALLLPFILNMLNGMSLSGMREFSAFVVFPVLVFALGLFGGGLFPIAARIIFRKSAAKTAGKIYNADLVGAAIGAFVVSVIVIPVLGVAAACYVSAALLASAFAVIWFWGWKIRGIKGS